MKIVIALLALFVSYNTLASDSIRLSEPVYTDDNTEIFGGIFSLDEKAIDLADIVKSPKQYLNKPLLVATSITKVCQKKGCFFISQIDNQVVRVSFKDYGFFIPTDSSNKDVTLKGKLIQTKLSEERAKHYREDLGLAKDSLVAGSTYEFVASAVAIPK